MITFCYCCNFATVGHTGMQISNLVVLSVIVAPPKVLTTHISKTRLPIVSRDVSKLQLK